MEFPLQLSVFVPIFFVIVLVYCGWKGYHNGFLLEAIISASLFICILVTWFLSTVLAKQFHLIDTVFVDTGMERVNQTIVPLINRVIWFALLFAITNVMLRLLRRKIRNINKIAVVGTLNQWLGMVVAFIKGCIYIIVLIVILASPMVKNGKEIINRSGLTPIKNTIQQNVPIAKMALDTFDYIERINKGESIHIDTLLGL